MVASVEPSHPDDEALVAQFDLAAVTGAFLDDPYPTYRALRRLSPVHPDGLGGVMLTRYHDCAAVYRSRGTSSDKREAFKPTMGDSPIYEHHTTSLVFNDPPYHTRVRHAIQQALVARVLRSMEAPLIALVDRLLDAAEGQREFDLIDDFAAAIPVEVIGNLLGIPHADRGPLRGWSLAILGALEPSISETVRSDACRAVEQFTDYLEGLINERRTRLVVDGSDALSLLIAAPGEEPLGAKALVHNAIFLLNAGHETTTNLIGNGIAALLEHPGELERLRRDPSLIESAVEECLRFESSNQLGNRVLTAPLDLGTERLAAGTAVTLCIGAANRDPRQFEQPEVFDIGRTPNRHLAFGLGVHACAGMGLARLEGKVAIGRLVARFARLERAGEPVRGNRARFRGYLHYPVVAT